MIYIEPNATFCKKYLSTFMPEGQTFFNYIYDKFHNVILKSDQKPYEYTLLKEDTTNESNSDYCTLDIASLVIDLTKEISKLSVFEDKELIYNKFFKFIDGFSSYPTIEIIDTRLPSHNISGWKLEDKIINYLRSINTFTVVQIDNDSKQKSFWKHLNTNTGVIIDEHIYPVNSLLYYEEFIGKARPSTRLLREEASYKEIDLGRRCIEIDAYNNFSINGFSEIKIKLK